MEEIWCNLRDRKFPERECFFNSKPEKIEEYIYKSGCQVCSYFKEVILTRLAQKDKVTVIEKPKVKRKISRSSLSHEKSEHIFDKSELVNYPAAELRGIKNQKLIVPGADT